MRPAAFPWRSSRDTKTARHRSDRGACLPIHPRAIRLDHVLPPAERIATDGTAGISTERSTPDFLRRFVDVAHHEKEQVADPEGITLPRPFDWKGALARVHAGELCVLSGRIDPLAPPPGLRLIEAAAVVIAGEIVDLFAAMPLQHGELTDDLLSLGVLWRALRAGHVTQVQRDIPIETRRAL